MSQAFYDQEFEKLCSRLNQTVDHWRGLAGDRASHLADQAKQFAEKPSPSTYKELLERNREAAHLAVNWKNEFGNDGANEPA